ncbi:MAG: glycogen/starch/alpha-glucan phosphorylase [Candidatus Margulisiibacteriota bacterium]
MKKKLIAESRIRSIFPSFEAHIRHHLQFTLGQFIDSQTDLKNLSKTKVHQAISLAVRDLIMVHWQKAAQRHDKTDLKRVCYFSLEFLMGRALGNNLINLGARTEISTVLTKLGLDINEVEQLEMDAGLGNGGLGRLAACYLDSLATLNYPATGYGLLYAYGMFKQSIEGGKQVETPDHWFPDTNTWVVMKEDDARPIKFWGKVHHLTNEGKRGRSVTIGGQDIQATPYDMPIVGYARKGKNPTVNTVRLWSAAHQPHTTFNLKKFNDGEYEEALGKVKSSEIAAITAVLYPNDEKRQGKEIRLKQQFLLVSASLQDIVANYKKSHDNFDVFASKAVLQINDTHPSLIVPELMRILIDEHDLSWEKAWEITTASVNYTNHTVLPEALETWSVEMMKHLLPRQFEIIEEINEAFRLKFMTSCASTPNKYSKLWPELSIIHDPSQNQAGVVRMAHLAIIGSSKVNGVSALHSQILQDHIFKLFVELYPGKYINVTNGVTPRRWLLQANPALADFITNRIGDGWITDLSELTKLEAFVNDEASILMLNHIKYVNKKKLVDIISDQNPVKDSNGKQLHKTHMNPRSIFDVQVKRLHEYKRQLMNALHILMLYNELKANPLKEHFEPITFMFGAKAAPGYRMAKNIIQLINILAKKLNTDPEIDGRLKIVFIEDYNVSKAAGIFAAAEVSEQISTAGLEASGTGNMKFALNGALTIGTLDGAIVEMEKQIGAENMFIFGLTAEEVAEHKKKGTYKVWEDYIEKNMAIREVVFQLLGKEGDDKLNKYRAERDAVRKAPLGELGASPDYSLTTDRKEQEVLREIATGLIDNNDPYFVIADLMAYKGAHDKINTLYRDPIAWGRRSLLNIARMGYFSSDRSIEEYVKNIWGLERSEP